MDDLLNAIKFLQAYGLAIQNGFEKFQEVLAPMTRQHMSQKAKGKLNTSYENYMSAVKMKNEEYIFVVELDEENWLANAVETGISSFSMKEGLLASPKAKKSKNGYRYLVVPMSKQKNGPVSGTDSNQDYQQRINDVLNKPKFGLSKLKMRAGGGIHEMQKVITDDPKLQGFYRTRSFDDAKQMTKNKAKKWDYVLFRVVTDNPNSKAKWEHPGINPAYILKETERWLNDNIPHLLDDMIKSEMDNLFKEFK